MRAFLLFLLLATHLHGAGLGVYNPAQHAVNGFMPTQLPGLVAWFDAQYIGFTNNSTVVQFPDRSGNSRVLTNGTSSQQPSYITNAFNGRNSVRFDGVDDWLHCSTNLLATNGIGSIFLIAVPKNLTATANAIFGQYSLGVSGRTLFAINQNSAGTSVASNFNMFFQGASAGDGASGFANHWTNSSLALLASFNNSGGSESAKIYDKGRLHDSFTVSNVQLTNTTVGNAYGLSLYANFDFLEMFITSAAISQFQLLQAHRYLGTKYGIVAQ